jgi:hypothetical protein
MFKILGCKSVQVKAPESNNGTVWIYKRLEARRQMGENANASRPATEE